MAESNVPLSLSGDNLFLPVPQVLLSELDLRRCGTGAGVPGYPAVDREGPGSPGLGEEAVAGGMRGLAGPPDVCLDGEGGGDAANRLQHAPRHPGAGQGNAVRSGARRRGCLPPSFRAHRCATLADRREAVPMPRETGFFEFVRREHPFLRPRRSVEEGICRHLRGIAGMATVRTRAESFSR
jgi:hypothetical protein